MVKRLQHTRADFAPRPGSVSAQSELRAVLRTSPQPLQTPPVRGITCRPRPQTVLTALRPPPLPQSTNTPQTLHSEPPTTPHTTHPSTYTPRGNSPSPCTLRGPKTNQRTKVKPQ